MVFCPLAEQDDAHLAAIIRYNLEKHGLDIPGTVYFDPELDHLSSFYSADEKKRFYYLLKDDEGTLLGGIGLADCPFFENCAELQKIYLAESAKGAGLGYLLIEKIEEKARELGYGSMYLETHSNLQAAIHIYHKSGYRLIPRPQEVCHGSMDHFFFKEL